MLLGYKISQLTFPNIFPYLPVGIADDVGAHGDGREDEVDKSEAGEWPRLGTVVEPDAISVCFI